ncbi:MAG: nucleoside triphosphate pyrophosphohydrolase [Deltaproteobacteria bacterium]|nr:nucleoside triphosphate pyrophosphohydrolase [Deltaproteobacteria bacterium]
MVQQHPTQVAPEHASLGAQDGSSMPRLVSIMRRLLAPDGCPWDREQTLETLRAYVLEEAFEVVDAIDAGGGDPLREELGDLLLQIVFQGELARARGWFAIDDVVHAISEKLVRRHPHVFGEEKAGNAQEVLGRWESIKAKEKKGRGRLDGIPRAMPALLRALRTGEKAAMAGYDWHDAAGARAKVSEELVELDRAVESKDKARIEEELGDTLFALANVARKLEVDPESALRTAVDKFAKRFSHAERAADETGRSLSDLDDAARDALWESAKRAVG